MSSGLVLCTVKFCDGANPSPPAILRHKEFLSNQVRLVVGSNPTRLPTNYNAGGSSMVECSFIYSPPLFNFNVAKGVPILWLVFCPPKGWKIGFKSLIHLATTFQRHREFLSMKTECTGSTPADGVTPIVAQR